MPVRTQCPSCKMAINAPDGAPRQRVRCPFCASVFMVEARNAPPSKAVSARPPDRDMLQTGKDVRPASRRSPPTIRTHDEPVVTRKSSGVPVGLLIGLGVGVAGLFFLLIGGGAVLWFVLSRSSDPPPPVPPPVEVVAQVVPAPAVAEPARQVVPAAQAVPEAPAAVEGAEEFVDLPERGEAMPGVAGLNPEQPQGGVPGPGMPGARPRVALSNGRAVRVVGRAGMSFQVDYRFEQSTPQAAARYKWVILTARGKVFPISLTAAQLQASGTLQARGLGATSIDAPYQTFLAIEVSVPGRLGIQVEKISDVLTIR